MRIEKNDFILNEVKQEFLTPITKNTTTIITPPPADSDSGLAVENLQNDYILPDRKCFEKFLF